MKTKLSWFQNVLMVFLAILSFGSGLIQGEGFFFAIGYTFGSVLIIFFVIWLFNKYVVPKINIKNKILIKTWQAIRIIITLLMLFWILMAVAGISGWFE